MNRTAVIVGSCLSAVVLIGLGQSYLEQSPPETKPLAAHTVPPRASPPTVQQEVTLRLKGAAPDAGALIKDYALLPDDDVGSGLKVEIVSTIAGHTQGDASEQFIEEVLTSGCEGAKETALEGVGRKGGVRGKELYEKILALSQKGALPSQSVPQALRRTGGKKAIEPITELMKSTSDWRTVDSCVVALEDYGKPEVLSPALERLDQLGLLDKPGQLPWFDAALFAKFVDTAKGDDLARGLAVLGTKPTLAAAIKRTVPKRAETALAVQP